MTAGRRRDRAVPGLARAGHVSRQRHASVRRRAPDADRRQRRGARPHQDHRPDDVHRRADPEPDGRAASWSTRLGLQLAAGRRISRRACWPQVHVDPRAAGDSVALTFRERDVIARRADRTVTAPYGQMINLGVVQFAVRARPAIETATLGIAGREPAIDGLLGGLLVTRRTETDVIDVGYTAARSASRAQRIVNTTRAGVPVAQRAVGAGALPAAPRVPGRAAGPDRQHAGARAGRARLFRSRQQLASSRDKLDARAERRAAARRPASAQLEADRQTFAARSSSSSRSGDEGPAPGPSRARHLAGHGREPGRRRAVPPAAHVPGPARLDDHRALAARRPTPT